MFSHMCIHILCINVLINVHVFRNFLINILCARKINQVISPVFFFHFFVISPSNIRIVYTILLIFSASLLLQLQQLLCPTTPGNQLWPTGANDGGTAPRNHHTSPSHPSPSRRVIRIIHTGGAKDETNDRRASQNPYQRLVLLD